MGMAAPRLYASSAALLCVAAIFACHPSPLSAEEPAVVAPRVKRTGPKPRLGQQIPKDDIVGANPFPNRTDAPSLEGGEGWINTSGPLALQDLRGKFVILDFWTYCCINCMHILPVLKKIEHAYPNEVVVIGVHSAKFATEQDSKSITEAVLRYEIQHPVINDADHVLWDKFQVTSWPTIKVVDPEGKVIA